MINFNNLKKLLQLINNWWNNHQYKLYGSNHLEMWFANNSAKHSRTVTYTKVRFFCSFFGFFWGNSVIVTKNPKNTECTHNHFSFLNFGWNTTMWKKKKRVTMLHLCCRCNGGFHVKTSIANHPRCSINQRNKNSRYPLPFFGGLNQTRERFKPPKKGKFFFHFSH